MNREQDRHRDPSTVVAQGCQDSSISLLFQGELPTSLPGLLVSPSADYHNPLGGETYDGGTIHIDQFGPVGTIFSGKFSFKPTSVDALTGVFCVCRTK